MSDLALGCQEQTVNLDLELFGMVSDRLSEQDIQSLHTFLPGPKGLRCFRLASKAAAMVQNGNAHAKYVHRPESGKMGQESFHVPVNDEWILHVDCAGFVRNVLKHVTKDKFVMALSDRNFMRAKDFYKFFATLDATVMDTERTLQDEEDSRMKWRIVNDLRMVIPGDVIVYRPRGNAAGGAAFTENDRKDVRHLLKAVKTSQVWHETQQEDANTLVTYNCARDPRVKPWVDAVKTKLQNVGMDSVAKIRHVPSAEINDLLKAKGYSALSQDTLQLMKECSTTTALNTGHIVFACGPAVHMGDNVYRIRVVHSTKHGKRDKETGEIMQGVQEYYRRFMMIQEEDGTVRWTREMKRATDLDQEKNDDGDDDDPNDDMEEDDEEDEKENGQQEEEAGDDLAGCNDVEVLAARMCF